MNKFNVGDKVKVLRQDGVIHTYFDNIDGVFEVVSVFNTREYGVSDGHLHQSVYADDLAPCPPQEDDEWGPWVVDYHKSLSGSPTIVEYDRGGYVRHKLKKPVVKKQIEVGGSYVTKSGGLVYKCIYIDGDNAWMVSYDGTPAYVWTLNGKSISLNETYNIDFSQNPKDQVPF